MSKEEKTIQKSDFYKVSINAIVVEDGFNVRHELVDIDSLAQSIIKEGQINPVIGYKVRGEDKFVLTAGHRRLAAIKLANEKYGAGITHINLMPGKNDEKSRVVTMLLDGEASKSLTTEEMVLGIARLLALGVSNKEIMASIAIGESTAQKYNLIKAAKAPEPIQAMIKNGVISVAGVNKLQRETKSEEELVVKAQEAVEKAKQRGSSKATTGTAGKDKVSADVAKLEEALSLADPTTAKYAVLKAVVGKLKKKASAEEIAKLLK